MANIKNKNTSIWFYRVVLLLTAAALLGLYSYVGIPAVQDGRLLRSYKWMAAGGLGLLVFVASLLGLIISWLPLWNRIEVFAGRVQTAIQKLRFFNVLPLLIFPTILILLVYVPYRQLFDEINIFQPYWLRLCLVWLLALCAVPFMKGLFRSLSYLQALAGALLWVGVVYKIAGYFPEVTNYPFTLAWSEASRFYYGSLFASKSVYGINTAWPFLHPTRYMLLAIPFVIPDLPIWVHRLWQVILWVGMTGLSAILLVRRLKISSKILAFLAVIWAFLFLFQGPVYYHLLVCVALVLGGYNKNKFWQSTLVIILASLWAGISRVNWFPVPAMLAITLYMLETPYPEKSSWWAYLRKPAIWSVLGLASALVAQSGYVFLSGQADTSSFASSFSSDLLWYRLWPSVTYAPGILPMIILITIPLLITAVLSVLGKRLHFWRKFSLIAMLLVLLGGGLVVSTKIGGGSNLHNLDAYLVLLLVWGSYLIAGRVKFEHTSELRIPSWVIALAVVMPLATLMMSGGVFPERRYQEAQNELQALQTKIQAVTDRGGKVLFIWQRQLLTFHLVKGVELVPDYETVDIMEMAMSNNRPYLDKYEEDLRTNRFDMIITSRQKIAYQDLEDEFPEENNVWVERVSVPLLDYYQPDKYYRTSGIQVYIPIHK
ncbi:MAG: hypothetical protein HGA53_01005 [Anaerolineaceae bacterium]|nr:hypothetical protein [Anaerolineaceae bacterium]